MFRILHRERSVRCADDDCAGLRRPHPESAQPHAPLEDPLALRAKYLVPDAGKGLPVNGRGRAALQHAAAMRRRIAQIMALAICSLGGMVFV